MTAAPALDNMGNRVSPPLSEKGPLSGARARFKLRETAASLLPTEAVYRCGRYPVGEFGKNPHPGYVAIRHGDGGGDVSGVVTCGSVWHCPVCAAKIAGERRRQIRKLLLAHMACRRSVFMVTLTVPHARFDDPRELRRAVAASWQKLVSGAPWKRRIAASGVMGFVRSLEVTHGGNGWHPHLHVLLFTEAMNDTAARDLSGWMFERWAAIVARAGLGKCSVDAWRFERAAAVERAGDYVLKGALDFELTHAHMKGARVGHRGPMQILVDVRQFGQPRDKALFRTYAEAFKGARQLTYSRGLLALYDMEDFADDDALERAAFEQKTVALLQADAFRRLEERGLLFELLELAGEGQFVLMAWAAAYGVPMCCWKPPPKENAHG